jgi:putative membrane protein
MMAANRFSFRPVFGARALATAEVVRKLREPMPDVPNGARVTYRGGLSRSIGRSLTGRLLGRWRGTTIDLNHDYQKWSRHEESTRHLRFWGNAVLSSQTLRRLLFPDLAIIAAVSGVVIANNLHVEALVAQQAGGWLVGMLPALLAQMLPAEPMLIAMPTEPFTLSGFALSLLITFRTQACHARYVEARVLWGEMINTSRDLGSRLLVCVAPVDALARAERERALCLLNSFAIAVKYHLTIDGCNAHIEISGCTDADVRCAKDAAMSDELTCVWRPANAAISGCEDPIPARLMRPTVADRPLFVVHELGLLIKRLQERGQLSNLDALELQGRLLALVRVVGGCERLYRTPIYTPFNHHTSRFLMLWTICLPAAMYPVVGAVGTAPVSILIAWGMLGIEDIGSRIENPMDTLPLWQYTRAIENSIAQLRAHDRDAHADGAIMPADATIHAQSK